MEKITHWVKSHPYASAGIVLVAGVLLVLYFRTPAAVANTGSTTGAVASGVVQGTALQQAQLAYNAQVATAQTQADLGKAVANANVQAVALQENTKVAAYADYLGAVINTNSSNVSIAGIQASVPIAQAAAAVQISGIQAGAIEYVTNNNNEAQKAITFNSNETALGIVNSNNNAHINDTNAALAATLNSQNLDYQASVNLDQLNQFITTSNNSLAAVQARQASAQAASNAAASVAASRSATAVATLAAATQYHQDNLNYNITTNQIATAADAAHGQLLLQLSGVSGGY